MEEINNGGNVAEVFGGSEKLLSICILSYNQADEIERLLNCLVPQFTDEIEIVVKDDSTNDETEFLVNRFTKVLPIRYYKGVKEGIDRTVIFLTQKALGKFVWWMGDDTIEPGGVAAVVEVIKSKPSVNFIWANYKLVNTKRLAIDIEAKECFLEKDKLLILGGAGLGFISATIFNRKLGLQGSVGAEKYVGSLFSNLYIVLYVIAQPGDCYYLRGPVVICFPTTSEEIKAIVNKSSKEIINRGFEVYGVTFPRIVREFAESFSKSAVRKVIKTSFGQTWRGMYVGWTGGWDNPKGKKMRLLKDYWSHPDAYLALTLFMLPLAVNKILYSMYRKIKNIFIDE